MKIFSRKIFALEVGLGQEELQGIINENTDMLDMLLEDEWTIEDEWNKGDDDDWSD